LNWFFRLAVSPEPKQGSVVAVRKDSNYVRSARV
jgi:hypothetical protein